MIRANWANVNWVVEQKDHHDESSPKEKF